MNEEICNCYSHFNPGMMIPLDKINPPTCAKCHRIIKMDAQPLQGPQTSLSLVPIEIILQELKNRFPHMIFMGKKFVDDKGMWMTSDTSQGDANICAGLGMEVALKNVYFKLITQQPTDKY